MTFHYAAESSDGKDSMTYLVATGDAETSSA
jgi:hypothetical protein